MSIELIEPGAKIGLVTVLHRAEKINVHVSTAWFCLCECGRARWLRANNLRREPPKSHRFCVRGIPYEIA